MIRDTSAQDRTLQPAARRLPVRWLALAAGLAVAAAVVAPGVFRLVGADSTVSASRLRVAEVRRGTLVRDVSVQGRVVAAVAPTLYARSGGTVTLAVHAGDSVHKGQVLAEIESPELASQLQQEQATLDSLAIEVERAALDQRRNGATSEMAFQRAVIDRESAEREVERNQRAYEMGAQAEIPVLRARDELAKARLSEANARDARMLERDSLEFELRARRFAHERQKLVVTDLARQVEELKLRAPVDGQVGQLLVQQRASVTANAAVLTVVDLSALEIEVQVPEAFAQDLAIGLAAEVREGSGRYAGEVSAISPEVLDGQVTGRVRFVGERPPGLRQSQRLTTRVLLEEHPDVLMVERGPFVDAGAGRVAYVVRDGVAERTPIEVGATSLNAVELLSGVREGERIVISGTDEFNGAERVVIR